MDCWCKTFVQIQILFIVLTQFISMSSGLVHRFETYQEYLDFRAQNEPQGILYYHHKGLSDDFKSRTKVIMDGSDIRMDDFPYRFMKFATVNCMAKVLKYEDIPGCIGGKRKFFAYKPNQDPERFSLQSLHSIDAFISHMIYFTYQDEISIIQDITDWEYHQRKVKGKKDLLFIYFNGLGSLEHYAYMLFFLEERQNYEFTFTNDDALAVQLGKNGSMPNGIWVVKCSAVEENSKDPCPAEVFSDHVIELSTIQSFVNLQKLPVVSTMYENGSTVYDEFERLHTLFLFVENEEETEMMREMAWNVSKRCKLNGILVRGVIVDRRVHAKTMEELFGITKGTMLPTVMLEVYGEKDPDLREIEPFIPDEDLVAASLFGFIYNMVTNRDQYFNSMADINYIHCIKSSDWMGTTDIKRETLIGVCLNGDADKERCDPFKSKFRRLVRTMYADGLLIFHYMFIDKLIEKELKDFEVIPSMMLVFDGKIRKFEKVDANFHEMLQWINKQLKINLPMLPISGSDHVQLPPHSSLDENAEIEPDRDSRDDLEQFQQDELALSATKTRNAKFYADETPQLTDKTFAKTVKMTGLLLALFYTPVIDDISFLVQPVIAAVNANMGEDTINSISAKVAKINCEDHYLACKGINIFPTIRFYSKGKLLGTYKGLLEVKSLLRALRLYQQPALQKLSEDSILKYREPSMENSVSHLSILGWFQTENEDFQVYRKVANEYHGKMMFAYATGESTRKLIPEMPQSSFVAAYVDSETSRVLNGAMHPFTEVGLREFLWRASIPTFGELTMSNFPVYKSFNKSMLVLFSSSDKKMESMAWKVISQVVKDNSMENHVFFTWMNIDNSVAKEIRRSYLGARKEKQPDIVIVNHTKAEVYHYSGPLNNIDVSAQELSMWIQKCSNGQVKATSYLKILKWQPLREGFDFLHLIDTNQRRAGLSEEDANKMRAEEMDEEEKERELEEPIGKRMKNEKMEKTKQPSFHGMKLPKHARSSSSDEATVSVQLSTSESDSESDSHSSRELDDEELDENELADLNGDVKHLDELSVDMYSDTDNKDDDEFGQLLSNVSMTGDETNNPRDEL